MTSPVLLNATVLKGRADELAEGLRRLGDGPFRLLAGEGGHAAFLGQGEFVAFFEHPRDDILDLLEGDADVRGLTDLLDRCTAFDTLQPERYLRRDVHHVADAGEGIETRGVGEGNM